MLAAFKKDESLGICSRVFCLVSPRVLPGFSFSNVLTLLWERSICCILPVNIGRISHWQRLDRYGVICGLCSVRKVMNRWWNDWNMCSHFEKLDTPHLQLAVRFAPITMTLLPILLTTGNIAIAELSELFLILWILCRHFAALVPWWWMNTLLSTLLPPSPLKIPSESAAAATKFSRHPQRFSRKLLCQSNLNRFHDILSDFWIFSPNIKFVLSVPQWFQQFLLYISWFTLIIIIFLQILVKTCWSFSDRFLKNFFILHLGLANLL